MSLKKSSTLLILIPLVLLIVALAFFNAGRIDVNNEGYVSSARINNAEPEPWSELGLQLHYAPEDEKAAEQFLENVALGLQAKGINKVFILPEYIDISKSTENLEGIFTFHFNLDNKGWQLSRQGKVEVSAEYFPLKQEGLTMMNTGITATATGRGWFNQSHFTQKLVDAAAEYWVQEVLRSFNIPNNQLTEKNEIRYLKNNLTKIPASISSLMPDHAEPVTFIMHQNNYLLSYLTEHDNLENFLNQEVKDRPDMQVVIPWVDAVGGRRMTELHTADELQAVKITYTDTDKIPYVSGYKPLPRNQEAPGEYLVTITFTGL